MIYNTKMSPSIKFITILFFILFVACNRTPQNVIIIDPDERNSLHLSELKGQDYRALKVAVSAILSPKETFGSYEKLFDFISDQMGQPIEFHQRRTYAEVNQLLETGQIDFAFICTGAFVELDKSTGIELLAVPVSNGQAYYNSYIITQDSFVADSFEDLRGTIFAFTDPLSNSGYFYTMSRLTDIHETPESFFESTLFSYAHDISIQLVARGVVDAASVNSLIYNYVEERNPERVEGIKVIEISLPYGNPPVVVSRRMDPEKREQIKSILFSMHLNREARSILDDILIDQFIPGDDSLYVAAREMISNLKK